MSKKTGLDEAQVQRIKELMTERGLNNYNLAKMVKKSPSTVGDYISGDVMPSAGVIWEISKVLNTSIDYLLGGKERPATREYTATLNTSMLAQIIEGVDSALKEKRLSLPADKKAELITILYDHFTVKGRVETEMIERQVKLLG